jgi:hypothetical protein
MDWSRTEGYVGTVVETIADEEFAFVAVIAAMKTWHDANSEEGSGFVETLKKPFGFRVTVYMPNGEKDLTEDEQAVIFRMRTTRVVKVPGDQPLYNPLKPGWQLVDTQRHVMDHIGSAVAEWNSKYGSDQTPWVKVELLHYTIAANHRAKGSVTWYRDRAVSN